MNKQFIDLQDITNYICEHIEKLNCYPTAIAVDYKILKQLGKDSGFFNEDENIDEEFDEMIESECFLFGIPIIILNKGQRNGNPS